MQLNFKSDGLPISIRLAPIVLPEITIPGEQEKTIPERYKDYDVYKILEKLSKQT